MFEYKAGGAATSLVQAVHKEAYFAEMIDLTDQRARISRSCAPLDLSVNPRRAPQAPPLAGGWLRGAPNGYFGRKSPTKCINRLFRVCSVDSDGLRPLHVLMGFGRFELGSLSTFFPNRRPKIRKSLPRRDQWDVFLE